MSSVPPPVGDRRTAVIGAVLVALGVVAALLLKARCGLPASAVDQYVGWCYSDIGPLWIAERLDVGAVPYLDHAVEYPPLTGLWMWLAALPASTLAGFYWWTGAILVVAGAVTGAVLGREVGIARTCVLALAPTLLVSGALNWDLPTLAFAAGALVAHRRGRDGLAGVLIGLGAAAKLWPVLLLPGVLLGAGVNRRPRAAVAVGAGALGAWALVNVPVAIAAPLEWRRFLDLSRERPADWDSLWRVVGGWFGDVPVVPGLNVLVGVITAVGILGLLVWTVRSDPPGRWHLVALPIVAWFLVVGKVWSPQFSLWLLPLLALAVPRVGELVLFAVADVAVSVTRFPYLGTVLELEGGWPAWPFDVAVVVRAVVVLTVALLAWRRAVSTPTRPRTALVPSTTVPQVAA